MGGGEPNIQLVKLKEFMIIRRASVLGRLSSEPERKEEVSIRFGLLSDVKR